MSGIEPATSVLQTDALPSKLQTQRGANALTRSVGTYVVRSPSTPEPQPRIELGIDTLRGCHGPRPSGIAVGSGIEPLWVLPRLGLANRHIAVSVNLPCCIDLVQCGTLTTLSVSWRPRIKRAPMHAYLYRLIAVFSMEEGKGVEPSGITLV